MDYKAFSKCLNMMRSGKTHHMVKFDILQVLRP